LQGLAQGGVPGGIAGAATGAIKPELIQQLLRRNQITRATGDLDQQLDVEGKRADIDFRRAQARRATTQPPQQDQRVIGAGEYPDLPAGTIINRVWNAEKKQWEDEVQNGRPVIAKTPGTSTPDTRYFDREEGVYRIGAGGRGELVPGIPGKPASDAQAAQAAEGEAIAASTTAAADELKTELDRYKGQLTENERAIREKEAYWRTEAQRRYNEIHQQVTEKDEKTGKDITYRRGEDDKRTVKDLVKEVKAADPDYQTGSHDETVENTKRLRDAIADGDKRLSGMAQDVRQGRAKGARRSGRGGQTAQSGVTLQGAIDAFKQQAKRDPTAEEIANIKRYYGLQ
jgi:hypothetical protein